MLNKNFIYFENLDIFDFINLPVSLLTINELADIHAYAGTGNLTFHKTLLLIFYPFYMPFMMAMLPIFFWFKKQWLVRKLIYLSRKDNEIAIEKAHFLTFKCYLSNWEKYFLYSKPTAID